MKPLSIHILTTKFNKDRQISILNTWLSNFEDYIFNTDFDTKIGNQILMTERCDHASNAIKHVLEYNRIHENKIYENFEWFYFCDDDTVPNMVKILEYIKHADKEKIHAYTMHSWAPDRSLLSISGGAGYLIPSNFFKLTQPKYNQFVPYADVQYALWIRENNIPLQHIEELNQNVPDEFGMSLETVEGRNSIRNQMSFHYVKTHEMREKIWNIYNSPMEE